MIGLRIVERWVAQRGVESVHRRAPGPITSKEARTAVLIYQQGTKPPTGPSPLTAPRPRPPSAPGVKRPPTSPPQRDSLLDAIDEAGDASDSKRLRATKQPPATSTTGRTRVPTGETRDASQPMRPRNPTDETRPGAPTPPGGASTSGVKKKNPTGPNPALRPPTGPNPLASPRPKTGP